jgi:peptide/nickel transport system substrate-binding protein
MSTGSLSLPTYFGSKINRRRFLKSTAAGAGAALLIACGGGGGGSLDVGETRQPGSVWYAKDNWRMADESKDAVRGGVYRGHLTEEFSAHLDPITGQPAYNPPAYHMYEMLMAKNRGAGVDPRSLEASQPVGALAESWEIAADGASVTFTMRPGVKFHDLPPVNSRTMDMEDWKTSHERWMVEGNQRAAMQGFVDKVEYPDARHMVWKFKTPYGPILDIIYGRHTVWVVMPKELNASTKLAETVAVGTGYKILDKDERSITLEYRKNAQYWGGDPFIDRWHTPIIPEYANRYSQFVSGNIMDFTPSARDVLLLHKDAPEAIVIANELPEEKAPNIRFGNINQQAHAYKDPRVRIALRRSIDNKSIAEFLSSRDTLEAAGIPIEMSISTHMIRHPGFWLNPEAGELGELSANYLYDPAEAKKLIAAAGYSSSPPKLLVQQSMSTGNVDEADRLVLDSFQRTGNFDIELVEIRSEPVERDYRATQKHEGLMLEQTQGGDYEADRIIFRDYRSGGNLPRGDMAFPDPRLDALADAQRSETDLEKRFNILKDFQREVAQVFPVLPGRHFYTTFSFSWPWLHNSAYGSSGSPAYGHPILGGHLQWLDPSMPNRDRRG